MVTCPPMARRRAVARDGGAAAVEFALVLVLFLTLVFGIIQYGYYFLQANSAEHAAREGARLAAVGVETTDCATWKQTVSTRGSNANIPASGSGSPTFSGATTVGTPITVTVTWTPARFGFPFVPFLSAGPRTEIAETRTEFAKAASC